MNLFNNNNNNTNNDDNLMILIKFNNISSNYDANIYKIMMQIFIKIFYKENILFLFVTKYITFQEILVIKHLLYYIINLLFNNLNYKFF